MFFPALLLATLLSYSAVPFPQDALAERYHAAFGATDEGALAELWRAHPSRILATIDGDLEGSLAAWEANPKDPDTETIAEMHARATWSARIASEVTGRPIFVDYATAFVGWDAEQKKQFRGGQQAYGRARGALKSGNAKAALASARECRSLALPLGDWWGTAMGFSGEGQAFAALGQHAAALTAFSQARLYYAQLGLTGSELAQVSGMVEALVALERWPRARATADAGVQLARVLGRAEAVAEHLRHRARAEKALGDLAAAEATEAELGR